MPYDATRDPLRTLAVSSVSPARRLIAVTPSDTVELDPYAKALWAFVPEDVSGGVATVRLLCVGAADSETVDVKALPGLQPLPPVQVRRIAATGTTTGVLVYALVDR